MRIGIHLAPSSHAGSMWDPSGVVKGSCIYTVLVRVERIGVMMCASCIGDYGRASFQHYTPLRRA